MAYSAKTIANYFIVRAQQDGQSLTPMKLTKLIYVAHGWSLALNNRPLINEPVQAWKFGPVIESVYQEFKHYGNDAIDCLAIDFDVDSRTGEIVTKPHQLTAGDEETHALLNRVWEVYRNYTGIQLSNWTHLPGSPWYQAWFEEGGFRELHHLISDEIIRDYFAKLGTEHGQRETS